MSVAYPYDKCNKCSVCKFLLQLKLKLKEKKEKKKNKKKNNQVREAFLYGLYFT